MAVSSRQNQNMMNLIRKVHGLVERPDLTKHRQSQDRIGAILGTEKGIAYEDFGTNSKDSCDYPDFGGTRASEAICDFVLSWRWLFNRQYGICQDADDKAGRIHRDGCVLL